MRSVLVVSSILCLSLSSCVSVIHHDEHAAANAATQFANAAFIEHDFSKARELMASEPAQQLSAEGLADVVTKMHQDAYPTQVAATDFEPMPGQRAMMIYLKGENDGAVFHYRFVMEGDQTAGYRVSGLFRADNPYPSQNKRPLR